MVQSKSSETRSNLQNLADSSTNTSPNIQNYGNKTSTDSGNSFKVMIRVRPPLPRELEGGNYIPTV
jgi:hypothetical protein